METRGAPGKGASQFASGQRGDVDMVAGSQDMRER